MILISGDDGVPTRVGEELDALGVAWRRAVTAADWAAADVEAAGVLGPDDLANLNAALHIAETHPDCRIVVRLFSTDLRASIDRLLGDRASVLSDTELAAPAFLQAALSGNEGAAVVVAGRRLEVAEVDPDDPRLIAALANADTPTEVLPLKADLGSRILALIDPEGMIYGARGALPQHVAAIRVRQEQERRRRSKQRKRRTKGLQRLIPKRAYYLLAAIVGVFTAATLVFALSDHLDPINAMYFTAATMATVGYGDINLTGAPDWLKLFDISLMAVSAVLLASVLALVTDALVSTRIDRALGRFPRPRRDHVIVCGLGKAGTAILRALKELDVPCVGIEQSEHAVGIGVARALEIPVVIGDARTPGTLERLHVDTARAVLAVTTDDLANLQAGLTTLERAPGVRVVLRMFDRRLAERLDRTVGLDLTRSVSALAAPAFAAALLGRALAQPLAVSSVPLRVLDLTVADGSPLHGRTIQAIHHERDLRVLALNDAWRPRDDLVVTAGAALSVVGTRTACDALLRT